jgi:hypothetical protein
MRVKLTRKLADHLDGIDLSEYCVGDVLDVPEHDGELLIAEEWAVPMTDRNSREVRSAFAVAAPDRADDRPARQMRLVSSTHTNGRRR